MWKLFVTRGLDISPKIAFLRQCLKTPTMDLLEVLFRYIYYSESLLNYVIAKHIVNATGRQNASV